MFGVARLHFNEKQTYDEVVLGDVIELQSGFAFSSTLFSEHGQKLVTPKNFTKSGNALFTPQNTKFTTERVNENYVCRPGDLLLLLTDLTQSCELLGKPLGLREIDGEVLLNQRIVKVTPDSRRLVKNFLKQYFLTEKYHKRIVQTASGTTVRHSSNKILTSLELSLPNLEEQTKIAEFLDEVDKKIRLLEARHEQLTLYKKAMMQKIFSQAIRFKRVDGGDYPDWETKTLNELTEIVSGLTYSPSDVVSKGTLVLRSSNVQNGKLDFNDCVFVEKKIPPNIMSQEGDILLCVRNGSRRLIGKSAYVGKLDMPATHGAFMSVLRAKNSRFVFQLLNNERFLKLVHMDLGATINSINTNNLKKYNFFVPSSETEQQKIANFLSSLDDKIAAVSAQITQMQNFKKGLLQQMFV